MNRNPSNPLPTLSFAGNLLVASPKLADPLFGRAVCLMMQQTPEAVAGVVLNRPVVSDVEPIWKQLTAGSSKTAEPPRHLHCGGPVSGPIVAVHDQETLADIGNGQGIYVAAQVETLKQLVYVAPEHYRLFVGHSMWTPSQLEQEIAQGLWYVLPATPELVFASVDEMWGRSMRRVGNLVMQYVTGSNASHSMPS